MIAARLPLLSLASVAALLAAPAVAQRMESETGSHIPQAKSASIPQPGTMSDQTRARATAVEFGECVVGRFRAKATAAVKPFPNSPEEARALRGVAEPECLNGGRLKMAGPVMRGAIYIALYRHAFGNAAPAMIAQAPDFSEGAGQPSGTAAEQAVALRQFGDCVARRDPANTRAVVLAPVGSAAENAGYAALAPQFNACVPQGANLTFTKALLGGLFAEILYREAASAAPVVTAEKNNA